jgi:lipoyl(octanoyl) transferase
MPGVTFEDIGLIDYKEAWDYQESLFKDSLDKKLINRKEGEDSPNFKNPSNHLIFCEHPHVFTLGKSGDENHMLLNDAFLKNVNATYYKINRGGDITYHGPGQIVGYPILDLEQFFTDIHKYLRVLEEAVILTLAEYNIKAGRIKEYTGVWLDVEDPSKARKICAMGVKCSRWVTMHGFAFNVNTDLSYFNHIVPCGIKDKDVTSMQRELGVKVNEEEVKAKLKKHIAILFDMELVNRT